MTQVLSLTTRDMESVVGPVHHHMSFDRSLRSRGSFNVTEDGRLSPSPLRTGSGRKRAATISTADAKQAVFEPLSVSTAVPSAQEVTRDIICLCTPAPKIPRPRNAFILYRQHHQSQVTADNPKLSNPEISKIIGDKWKHESEDIKETWKKLAEEEKQRHQQQYPNYRYQPRRGTKAQQNWASTSPTDENGRCPKCHGRSISTPRTPSTPFATSPGGNYALASQSQPNLRRLDTALSRRSSLETSPTSTVPFATQLPPVRDADASEPSSPDSKRRRANAAGGYHAVVGPSGAYTTSRPSVDLGRTPPDTGSNLMRLYSGNYSDIGSLPRSHAGPMPPPLRPSGMAPWTDSEQHNHRHSGFDESLRLPPLQTSIPPSPVRSPAGESRHAGFPSTRLNVSPLREPRFGNFDAPASEPNLKQKLGMLSKICQLVPTPGRRNPRGEVRGAVIAVEGANASLVDEIGHSLEKGMVACGEVSLKTWSNDSGHPSENMDEGHKEAGAKNSDDTLFKSYTDTVLSWRQKSRDIKSHVTGGCDNDAASGKDTERNTRIAEAQSTEACTPPEEDRSPTAAAKTPVALVKGGYSLTLSDAYASAMPTSDKYSPLDHWHWMASMWRATVCPDLVVYVRNNDKDDEFSQPGAVDVSRRMGLIVVKVAAGKALDEATERRMAFEVMEWLREGAYQDEVSPNWRSNSL